MKPSTRLLDEKHNIIEIIWTQNAQPIDFERITKEIEELTRNMNGEFDVIVDNSKVKAFLPESQVKLVEHQKALIELGMKRAAIIVSSAVSKLQLSRSAKQAENSTESHFSTYEEALAFLKGTN